MTVTESSSRLFSPGSEKKEELLLQSMEGKCGSSSDRSARNMHLVHRF